MTTPAHPLLAALADGSLPPAQFDHRRHIEAAWLCLRDGASPDAGAAQFCDLLRRYVAHLGASAKYHETLTIALLRLIDARRRAMPDSDWPAFAAAHPELFSDARALVLRYYSPALLDSDTARTRFVEPDLAALP